MIKQIFNTLCIGWTIFEGWGCPIWVWCSQVRNKISRSFSKEALRFFRNLGGLQALTYLWLISYNFVLYSIKRETGWGLFFCNHGFFHYLSLVPKFEVVSQYKNQKQSYRKFCGQFLFWCCFLKKLWDSRDDKGGVKFSPPFFEVRGWVCQGSVEQALVLVEATI